VIHLEDTVRLKATFKNFAGVLTDLTENPTLKIYNDSKEVVTTIAGSSITHGETGEYYYDYTTTAEGLYYYEFSGTLEGTTILRRGSFGVVFCG